MTNAHQDSLFSSLALDINSVGNETFKAGPQGSNNKATVIEIAPVSMPATDDGEADDMCLPDDLDISTSRLLSSSEMGDNLDPDAKGDPIGLDNVADSDAVDDVEVDVEEENYGINKIRTVMEACANDPSLKPSLSYIALISLSIDSSDKKRMLLSEIYGWIGEKFPYYKSRDRSWRNSIRHNLSLNECFIKAGRSENGKGNYWSIHPANIEDFSRGDFRRRRARRRVRKCNEELERLQHGYLPADNANSDPYFTPGCNGYVMMTSTQAPAHALIRLFGADNILSTEERLQAGLLAEADYLKTCSSTCIATSTVSAQSDMYSTPGPNVLYHPASQNEASVYCMTQYPSTSELSHPFAALTSVAEGYRHMEQTMDGCQFTTAVKGFSNLSRYSPY